MIRISWERLAALAGFPFVALLSPPFGLGNAFFLIAAAALAFVVSAARCEA